MFQSSSSSRTASFNSGGGANWQPTRQLDEDAIRRRAATRRAERAAKGDVYFLTDDVDEFGSFIPSISFSWVLKNREFRGSCARIDCGCAHSRS
jgi:hypothetical protein